MPGRFIHLPFLKGQDESGDRHAKSTGLVRLENGRINHDGSIEKRPAYSSVSGGTTDIDGGTISGFGNVLQHDAQLVGIKADRLWSKADQGWVDNSELSPYPAPRRYPVARDARGITTNGGTAFTNGVIGHCYEVNKGTSWERFVEVQMLDAKTGAVLNTSYTPNSHRGSGPRMVSLGNKIYLFLLETSGTEGAPVETLAGYIFDTATLTWGNKVTLIDSATALAFFDVSANENAQEIALLYTDGEATGGS